MSECACKADAKRRERNEAQRAFVEACNEELADELASLTIVECLMTAIDKPIALEWFYASVCLMNNIKELLRNRGRREVPMPIIKDDDGEDADPLNFLISLENPEHTAYARHVVTKLYQLPDGYRQVMRYVALEYTTEEISNALNMRVAEVYWRVREGRKLLRQNLGEVETKKRGHAKFHGIRKDHHRWSATFRSGAGSFYLGYFGSAEDAARAYDAKAIEILGAKARLNFPVAA